jgi:hypothetical protein
MKMEAEYASETFIVVIKMRIKKMRNTYVFSVKEIQHKYLDVLYF